jgi:maltose alpha-D-glucosyltransferase/alpha-amylase
MLQAFIPNEGDAWRYSLDEAKRYFERVLSRREAIPKGPVSLVDIRCQSIPPIMQDLIGGAFLEMIGLLGRRTAEMHLALASSKDPVYEPETFSPHHQRTLYQSMRVAVGRAFQSLAGHLAHLPENLKTDAAVVLAAREILMRAKGNGM